MRLSSLFTFSALEIMVTSACKSRQTEEHIRSPSLVINGENPDRNLEDDSAAVIDENEEQADDSLDAFDDVEEDSFCSVRSGGARVKGLPGAVIIGSKKGGTRALLEFLNIHSQIRRSKNEIHFYDKKFEAGVDWYIEQMPGVEEGQIALEKTPGYFHSPGVARRLHLTNNKTKLLLIVRDPVTRLISDYNQFRSNTMSRGKSYPDLASLILTEDGDIDPKYPPVIRSRYHQHMQKWLEFFPREQIYVVDGDSFISSPWIELNNLEGFLGVKHELSQDNFYLNKTKGFYCGRQEVVRTNTEWRCVRYKCLSASKGRPKPRVEPDLLLKMRRYFEEPNKQFFKLIGKTFDWNDSP